MSKDIFLILQKECLLKMAIAVHMCNISKSSELSIIVTIEFL